MQRRLVEMASCHFQGLDPRLALQCHEPLSTAAHTVPPIPQGHSNNLPRQTQCFKLRQNIPISAGISSRFKFYSDFIQFFSSSTSSSQMYNPGQSDFLQRSPMLGDVAPMDIPYKGFLPRTDTRNKVCSSGLCLLANILNINFSWHL